MEINQERLLEELEMLATFSDAPAPAVTRVAFSPVDLRARAFLKGRFAAAGLVVREDAVGNIFALWTGTDPNLAAVATGSHIDAIPHAGRYDGTVGVLGGLEAIRTMQRSGIRPRRSVELLMFTSEEPTRFGIGCLGSRLLGRAIEPVAASQLKDREGSTLEQVQREAGFSGSLADVPLAPDYYSAFIELHIEQGALLERAQIPLGVVTAIAAPASLRILIEGEGGHAGGVLMPDRRDAFVAAAEVALAIERLARSTGAIDTVATVGLCEVFPGAINSIPSRVELGVDIRDVDLARRDGVLSALAAACEEIAVRRKVAIRREVINADAPAQSRAAVVDALVHSCEAVGSPYLRMVSRAYHDSLFMSRIAPVAMLCIPCRGGVSHRPDEYAAPEDITRGVLVLAHALTRLAA